MEDMKKSAEKYFYEQKPLHIAEKQLESYMK